MSVVTKLKTRSVQSGSSCYLKDGNTLRYQEKINLVHEIKVFGDYDSIFASYETHGVSNSGSFLKPVNLVKTSNQIHGKLSLG